METENVQRVRGREGGGEYGSAVSPSAKRPTLLVMPDVIPSSGEQMSLADLTATVKNLDARGEATRAWAKSTAEATEDHADQLEAFGRDMLDVRLQGRGWE